MKLYIGQSTDWNRLQSAVDRRNMIATASHGVGRGPDSYYVYEVLAVGDGCEDPGDDRFHAAAFGRGPEDRAVICRAVSQEEAIAFVRDRARINDLTFSPTIEQLPVPGYRTASGRWACWATPELINYLYARTSRDRGRWRGRNQGTMVQNLNSLGRY